MIYILHCPLAGRILDYTLTEMASGFCLPCNGIAWPWALFLLKDVAGPSTELRHPQCLVFCVF